MPRHTPPKPVSGVVTTLADLPIRTMAEADAERRASFEKAWAQKRAREEAEKRGDVFVPDFVQAQKAAGKSATDALMAAARAKAEKEKQVGAERAKVVKQRLMQANHDSESDSD